MRIMLIDPHEKLTKPLAVQIGKVAEAYSAKYDDEYQNTDLLIVNVPPILGAVSVLRDFIRDPEVLKAAISKLIEVMVPESSYPEYAPAYLEYMPHSQRLEKSGGQ